MSYKFNTGNMWMVGSKSRTSLSVELDFLDLCKDNVRNIEDLVKRGRLLNQRQCQDLSTKLSITTRNVQELVLHCRRVDLFRPALENLYRYLEKARLLVHECADEDWCAAAVTQSQNENAFREILLDVSLCYNAIYEIAKTIGDLQDIEDLRDCSVFWHAINGDIQKDQQDLQKRLEEASSVSVWDQFRPWRGALKQCLAKYLLVKLKCTSEQSQASTIDTCSAILWAKETEPSRTWGNYRLLGTGAGSSGVCSTTWLGIPCAKKEFHPQEAEKFFLKEAGILACLKHPCIINFFCCGNGQEQGDRFITMELLEKSLSKLIEEQKDAYFPLSVAVEIMVQIARGMCYLHDQGVAHRDLKPQNVVVNRLTSPHLSDHFSVKLVDFGMSKTKIEVSKSITMTALGIGTTMYRAPEVHPDANPSGKGKVNWFKADVFSFSMTCAHLLSLKRPFGDMERLRELYKELMTGRRPELPSEYPEELLVLLRDCWDSNPCSRPSFMEICTRLEMFRHTTMRGYLIVHHGLEEGQRGGSREFDFIETMLLLKSSVQRQSVAKYEIKESGMPMFPCTCGHSLEELPQSPYKPGMRALCDICGKTIVKEVYQYHCETCEFDAHPNCAEFKDTVNIFFHDHPLQVIAQNHYNHKLDAICGFCKKSVEGSEWVYRCEQCDFVVHAPCTKYPRNKNSYCHSHLLTITQSLPGINLLCACCDGDLEGYFYTCILRECAVKVHPLCAIIPTRPLCIFDCSHRLRLVNYPRSFHCGRCGALGGFSWSYCCLYCHVDIHLDCVDDIEEEEHKWMVAYDRFMLKYAAKDDHSKLYMISELLDMLASNALEESSSSSSRPQRVARRVQPTIQTTPESLEMIAADANFRNIITAETKERKSKKMAAKKARQKVKAFLKAQQGAMLENLEKLLHNLQNSKTMSKTHAETFAAAHVKLKKLYFSMLTNADSPFTASSSQ